MTVNFDNSANNTETSAAVSEGSVQKVLSALQQQPTTDSIFATDCDKSSDLAVSSPPPTIDEAKFKGPTNYTDGYAYEVPRPFLTLQQAAQVLGKSLRSIERSLLGRWGNKLPDGWVGRKIHTEQGEEWRILPPPGFRVKLNTNSTESDTSFSEGDRYESNLSDSERRRRWLPERQTLAQPAIVIERTEEVEYLLRELVAVQKSLSEERRLHLDDMRLINQLQSSMRLLEVNAAEQARAKAQLEATRIELQEYKDKFQRLNSSPWWKRLFKVESL